MGRINVINNPAIEFFRAKFRDANTSIAECNTCVENISFFLAGETSRFLSQSENEITSPLGTKMCSVIDEEVILVPVLRAGFSLLSGFQRILPCSKVGFIWAHRNDQCVAEIDQYKFPNNINGHTFVLLDTMLATGNTINSCIDCIRGYKPKQIISISVFATKFGIQNILQNVTEIVSTDITDELDKNNYIYPGVGDAGDRLYGK